MRIDALTEVNAIRTLAKPEQHVVDEDDFTRERITGSSKEAPEGTTAEMAERLSAIALHRLPPDHYENLLAQVSQVTPAQVARLAKKELPPEAEVVVLLGDETSLKRAFAAAGIDKPEIIRAKADTASRASR